MHAYGVFFDRGGAELKIDYAITEEETKRIFNDDDDVLGPCITAFVTESAIRGEFGYWGKLWEKAQKGKPLILDDEESLIALAGSREEALEAFKKEYMSGFD